jgi:hypothetical protein
MEYFIEIVFEGINLDDPETDDALSRAEIAGLTRLDDRFISVGAGIIAEDAQSAAAVLIANLHEALPAAQPYRVARDLVNTSEIADRIGVSRQTVRNWCTGERLDGSFPPALDVVGDQKIWEWGTVNAWLRFNMGLDDGLFYPSPWELGEMDAYIKVVRTGQASQSTRTASLVAYGNEMQSLYSDVPIRSAHYFPFPLPDEFLASLLRVQEPPSVPWRTSARMEEIDYWQNLFHADQKQRDATPQAIPNDQADRVVAA